MLSSGNLSYLDEMWWWVQVMEVVEISGRDAALAEKSSKSMKSAVFTH